MIKLTMSTGDEMELSISFGGLRRIKDKYEQFYNSYFEAVNGKSKQDPVLMARDIVYTAYLCKLAMDGNLNKALNIEEFEDILPEDITMVIMASTALINPNQTRDFEAYSRKRQESEKTPSKSRNSK